MCTLVMPADYEMLIARSPPIGTDFLNNYRRYEPRTTFHRPRQQPQPPPPPPRSSPATPRNMPVAVPRRPCLVVRPEDAHSSSADENDLPSPTRLKKKVVFADDKGLSLTQVRLMTEPSSVPPNLNLQFLAQVTQGMKAEVTPEPWEVTFPQPASDYLEFRRRLDRCNVSLENVIVKEAEDIVVGTVKVKNLSFHKEVFVRVTSDEWKTHEDAFCTYVPSNNTTAAAAGAYVLYDTFSFRLTLPPRSTCVEFCVCFRCAGAEFWDNNAGKNYILLKKNSACGSAAPSNKCEGDSIFSRMRNRNGNDPTVPIESGIRCTDAVNAKLGTWSEFASWNHLDNSSPYW